MSTTSQVRPLDMTGIPIEGARARFFADTADYARLAALFIVANQADGVPWMPTAQQVQLEFDGNDGADPVHDVVFVEVGDRLVAATGVDRVVRDGVPTYELWGAVDPALRRRRLGTWLMDWTLDRVRERASREDPLVPVNLGAFSEEAEIGHRALLAANGLQPVRHFFLMRRPLDEPIPDAPLPDGIEIRPVEKAHWRAIFDAEEDAFRDHWGHRPATDLAFQATFAHDELDTALWVVAWDGDQIAGVVQNWIWAEENEKLGVHRGWLEHISVRRPWRRRGLARALTARSLVKFRERGLDEGMLGVESENANGALGLYEGLGFSIFSRADAYRRSLQR